MYWAIIHQDEKTKDVSIKITQDEDRARRFIKAHSGHVNLFTSPDKKEIAELLSTAIKLSALND